MTDPEFLWWLRDRLIHVYGESENGDCVQRLDAVGERLAQLQNQVDDFKDVVMAKWFPNV